MGGMISICRFVEGIAFLGWRSPKGLEENINIYSYFTENKPRIGSDWNEKTNNIFKLC
jgi:hypothetical protein